MIWFGWMERALYWQIKYCWLFNAEFFFIRIH